MPSLEAYHKSLALIGLGQTSRSTGGYDLHSGDDILERDPTIVHRPGRPLLFLQVL